MKNQSLRNWVAFSVLIFYLIISGLLVLWPIAIVPVAPAELAHYKAYSGNILQMIIPGILAGALGFFWPRKEKVEQSGH
ncbi:MAG: hypothetical protein ACSHX0_13345 [Akkermansiaceae bacterium]